MSNDKRKEIYNSLESMEFRFKLAKSIVQNEGEVTKEEFDEWCASLDEVTQGLDKIKKEVKEFYKL